MKNLALETTEESPFPEDYKEALSKLIQLIERNLATNIHFGPTYSVSTTKNRPLRILTLIADQPLSPETLTDIAPNRQYILLAVDENDEIVGYESCDLYARQSDHIINNFIMTGHRDEGLSTPIEMALIDILEREASRLGTNIEWYVSNESDHSNPEMQTRWNAHYGLAGTVFGNSPKARPREKTRTFTPSSQLIPLTSIESCDLIRTKGDQEELKVERTNEQPSFNPGGHNSQTRTQLEIYISNTQPLL